MKRRRIILASVLVAVVAGIFLGWPRKPDDPVYEGKHLSQWLDEAVDSVDILPKRNASKAIKAVGTNALPYLLADFTRTDSPWRANINRWLTKYSPIRWRLPIHENRVRKAGHGLKILGLQAAAAMTTLAPYLGDPARSTAAAWVMSEAGTISLPYFVKASSSTNLYSLQASVMGLGELAKETELAVPPLVQLLNDTNCMMRQDVIRALALAGRRPDLVVPLLAQSLSDSEPNTRFWSAEYLGKMGKLARPALTNLLALMTSPDYQIWASASNAVFQIDPTALPPRSP